MWLRILPIAIGKQQVYYFISILKKKSATKVVHRQPRERMVRAEAPHHSPKERLNLYAASTPFAELNRHLNEMASDSMNCKI
jgi:uracil DNA glycosylase